MSSIAICRDRPPSLIPRVLVGFWAFLSSMCCKSFRVVWYLSTENKTPRRVERNKMGRRGWGLTGWSRCCSCLKLEFVLCELRWIFRIGELFFSYDIVVFNRLPGMKFMNRLIIWNWKKIYCEEFMHTGEFFFKKTVCRNKLNLNKVHSGTWAFKRISL